MKNFYQNHTRLFWFIVVALGLLTFLTVRDIMMEEESEIPVIEITE